MICWNEIEDWLVNWFVSGMNFCGMKAKKAMESIYWWNELLLRNETKGMKRRTKQQQLRGKLINKIKHFFLPLREKKCWLLLNGKGASHSITFFNHQSHSASFKLKTFNLICWIVNWLIDSLHFIKYYNSNCYIGTSYRGDTLSNSQFDWTMEWM